MITDDLYALAPQIDFTTDTAAKTIYGVYKGFGMSLRAVPEYNCFIFNTWARKGALSSMTAEEWLNEYSAKPENSYIKAKNFEGNLIATVLLADTDSEKTISRLFSFVFDITSFFMMNYFANACAKCGSSIGLKMMIDSDGTRTQLCKMCCEKEQDEIEVNSHFTNASSAPVTPVESDTATMEELFAQSQTNISPQANAYAQPQANSFAQPQTNYAQPQANGFAQSTGYAQPDYNAQNATMGAVGMMGAAGTMGTMPNQGVSDMGVTSVMPMSGGMNIGTVSATGGMDSIDPNTAPESTGFSTPESIAAIPPPIQTGAAPDYRPPVIENDFRADPSYTEAPPVYTPITPAQVQVANSNPILGFIGAVLFGLIACVIWVIIGKLGYISYIGGLAMGFCTVTGYKLLGKKFDVFGIISCIIVILIAVLGSNIFIEVSEIFSEPEAQELVQLLGFDGFWDVFFNFFSFIKTLEDTMHELWLATGSAAYQNINIMRDFIINLVVGYLFAGVGFCIVGVNAYKESKY